jgi:hypothetical protein
MKQTVLQLTGLEVFFISTTMISLFINLIQMWDRRMRLKPIMNSLIAAFNETKTLTNHLSWIFNIVFQPDNPHREIATLRWEYGHVTQMVISSLAAHQETLVGILVTLNPGDPTGKETFRAANYGLTQEEQERRTESYQTGLVEQARAAILRDMEESAAKQGDQQQRAAAPAPEQGPE